MFKKRKADAMTDWAISLAIFLLYLAWFFIFIRPTLYYEEKPDVAYMVNDGFENFASWEVYKYPVIVKTNYSGNMSNEPIIVEFGYDFNKTNSFLINKTFFISDRKLFFVQEILKNSVVYLVNSAETYSSFSEASDLAASPDSASTAGFTAQFSNGLLQSTSQINSFSVKIDGALLNTLSNNFVNQRIAAQYSVKTQSVNHTNYVFKGNPRVYGIITPATSVQAELKFNIHGFQYYYSASSGSVPYPFDCVSFTSNRIDFYTNSSNLLFAFDKPVIIDLCAKNSTIDVAFEFTSAEQMLYKIIEFSGSYLDSQKYIQPYSARLGARETFEGLSEYRLLNLTVSDYERTKSSWKTPEFQLIVNYTSGNLTFGKKPPEMTDIYVAEYRTFVIDKFANLKKAFVNIKSWAR